MGYACTPGCWIILLYPDLDNLPGGELGRLFCLAPTLLESIRGLGAEWAVRDSSYLAGYAEVVLRRMECIVWNKTLRLGYC